MGSPLRDQADGDRAFQPTSAIAVESRRLLMYFRKPAVTRKVTFDFTALLHSPFRSYLIAFTKHRRNAFSQAITLLLRHFGSRDVLERHSCSSTW